MKTHTSRWRRHARATWILKQRIQDGGAVLATIQTAAQFRHEWSLPDGRSGVCMSHYAAQRACRKVLEEAEG